MSILRWLLKYNRIDSEIDRIVSRFVWVFVVYFRMSRGTSWSLRAADFDFDFDLAVAVVVVVVVVVDSSAAAAVKRRAALLLSWRFLWPCEWWRCFLDELVVLLRSSLAWLWLWWWWCFLLAFILITSSY